MLHVFRIYVMNMETCTIFRERFFYRAGRGKSADLQGGAKQQVHIRFFSRLMTKNIGKLFKHFHGVRRAASFSQGQVPHHGASIRGGNGEDEDVPHTHLQDVPKQRKTFRVFSKFFVPVSK